MTGQKIAPRAIEPVTFHVEGDDPARGTNARRHAIRTVLIVSGLAALLFGVFTVVVVLPRWVATPAVVGRTAEETSPPAADAAAHRPPDTASSGQPLGREDDDAAFSRERKRAQEQLRSTLDKLASLEALQADAWAKSEMRALRSSIAAGEKAYGEKRYNAAQNIYLDSEARIERLRDAIPSLVERLIDEGNLAIANGDSIQAAEAFGQVLAIEPGNERARKGAARAKTLDRVSAMIVQAEGYERLEEVDKALSAYRAALALDPDVPGAAAAITRLEQRRLARTFRTAMSRGFRALEQNDFGAARAAFEDAAKIDPNSADAQAALKQVANAETSFSIARQMRLAREAAGEEDWESAVKHYAAALALDPRLADALDGKRHAQARHRMQVLIATYLDNPERLGSELVRAEAQQVLDEALAMSSPGVRLSRAIADLDRALVAARTPVVVGFQSDNATEVILYRVGELGNFELREVSLLPGQYTVVGKRDGYRDVRVEFQVKPGDQNILITVQCDEKFAFGS